MLQNYIYQVNRIVWNKFHDRDMWLSRNNMQKYCVVEFATKIEPSILQVRDNKEYLVTPKYKCL